MKRLKWTACVALLIANFSSTFATSNELFTNAIPQTLDLSKEKPSDLYSRKDFDRPRERETGYLGGSLLFMFPLFPSQGIAPGTRITGGITSKLGGMEVSYTRLTSSLELTRSVENMR